MSFIYVGFGGFIGALARYSFNLIFGSILGLPIPLATLFVNILGSFVMGVIFYFTSNNSSEFYKLFFMTGILGGFTTFSAFSLDSINMFIEKEYQNLFLYISISVFLSIFSLYLGFILSRFISP
ncbi:MAG: fluoride efflux transporter CrcB [Alphaproteobacteria bacterium]|nr:MAG: fluoride efflux transporter CrcB [alpha proteobacterium MED-G09]